MQIPYLVTLTGAPAFPPSDRIAAECRFAKALERACADTGGVVATFNDSQANVEAWINEAAESPLHEPDTMWTAALQAADAATWADVPKPAGALFDVRVNAPVADFFIPEGVPF